MKYILGIVMLIVISVALCGGTVVKVKKIEGKMLFIDKGSEQGVEKSMIGKVQQYMEDSTTQEKVPITVGKFVIRRVDNNSSELLIKEMAEGAELTTDPRDFQVEFDVELLSLGQKKLRIIDYIKKDKLTDAAALLEKSLQLKKNDNDLLLLKDVMGLLLADEVTVNNYIEYKARKPDEAVLNALWKKLKAGNDRVPPGKYLDKSLPIAKKEKGYYEITFPDKNNHVMIYIPEKNIFIDKFEVSNARYLKFANPLKKIKFSSPELANYPDGCPGYPVIVGYEEAKKYCEAYGLRLPSEEEWQAIAGASQGYRYGWGNEEVDKGNIYRANYESMDDGYIEAAPVESFTGYLSPYGLVNMIGNVSEWVKEKYSKGGNFLSEPEDLKITGKNTNPIYVGFRCVMEAGQ